MVTITSNYHWRETSYGVPDWLGIKEKPEEEQQHEFVLYRGERVFLEDVTWFGTMWTPFGPKGFEDWQGMTNDCAFWGLVLRHAPENAWVDGHEGMIQVGRWFSQSDY